MEKLEEFFKLKERGTSVKIEVLAGITTFMTMAYVLVVQPGAIIGFGDAVSFTDINGLVITKEAIAVTCAVISALITLLMGFYANLPFALATGMGTNFMFGALLQSNALSFGAIMAITLISGLNEERSREILMISRAEVSEFRFSNWYDQERFIIELQSNFEHTPDLDAVMQFSGNVEAKTTANYGDDGITQKATISKGIASKVDAIVPNPVVLVPYRTFQEVAQPASNFVFRVRDNGAPEFCLIEAGNYLWRNEAIENVKEYLKDGLKAMPEELMKKITIIG